MKEKFILIIVVLFIVLLSLSMKWQFKNLGESIENIELPKFDIEIAKLGSQDNENIIPEEFLSEDGRLRLVYPSSWKKVEDLSVFNKDILREEINAKIILMAQSFDLSSTVFASLIVQELQLEGGDTLEEVIELIENDLDGKAEITKSERISDSEYYLETKQEAERAVFLAKERIILFDGKAYLVDIFALEKDWPSIENDAKDILDSVNIIK